MQLDDVDWRAGELRVLVDPAPWSGVHVAGIVAVLAALAAFGMVVAA